MLVISSSSRFFRVLLVVGSAVICGILISGWYIGTVGSERPKDNGLNETPAASSDKHQDEPVKNSSQAVNFPFPKKIWQTGPSLEVKENLQPLQKTWFTQNPDFRYELLNDQGAERYVRDWYANKPDIVNVYFAIPDVILRADLWRLLVMAGSGGVYSDLDTGCLMPITEWIPEEYYSKANFIVGVEVDLSQDDVDEEEKKKFQLCQWTLMAMPGSKHLESVINGIIDRIKVVAEEKEVPLMEVGDHITVPEVITTTGPIAFTKALFKSLSESLHETIDARNVSGLRSPLLLDDVLFLPVNAFGGHQVHSHSGSPEYGPLFVEHKFDSSWWKAHDPNKHS